MNAIAQGTQGLLTGLSTREEAYAKKMQATQDIQKMQATQDAGLIQKEVAVLKQELEHQQAKFDKTETHNSLRMYLGDGNVGHLNRLFKENERIQQAMGVTEVAEIDPYSSADAQLLRAAGGDPADFQHVGLLDGSEEAEIARKYKQRYVKSRMANGEWKVTDMQNVYAGTGFNNTLDEEQLKKLMLKLKLTKASSGSDGRTSLDKNATKAGRILERKSAGEELSHEDQTFLQGWQKEIGGTTAGKLTQAEERKNLLVESFGGEDSFWATDFSEPANFNKAYANANAIMQLNGNSWTTAERKQIHDIKSLIALGNRGKELTPKETGMLDNMLSNISKYMTDEVGGVAAKSAYAAFRNTVRHALYGAALTEAEIASFNEAFGNLGQKLGPVLEQFKTSLVQVKAELESIANLNDPYVAKVFLGADQHELDAMIIAIDQRIDDISGRAPKEPKLPLRERLQQKLEAKNNAQ